MKLVLGVLAGLAVISGMVLLGLLPLFAFLGPDRALVAGTLEFNSMWVGIAMVVSLAAASVSGWIAHRVGQGMAAVVVLIALVVIFGLMDAAVHQVWMVPAVVTSYAALSWIEVLTGLREPLWYDLALPLLMALFIWISGSSRQLEHAATLAADQRRAGKAAG